MSDPIEMSDVAQRYRELGREDVPPELDRRVLEAARSAVASDKGGRGRSWLKWSAPLALAASAVLVVTVVIESGVQNDASFATKVAQEKPQQPQPQGEPPAQFVADEPVASQAPPVEVPESEALAKSAAIAKTEQEAKRARSAPTEELRADAKAMRDEAPATVPASPPPPAAVVDTREAQLANSQPAVTPEAVASVRQQADSAEEDVSQAAASGAWVRRPGRTAGPRGSSSPAALSIETRPPADDDAEHTDPAKWLEEIRDLRRAGQVVEADRAWEQFREAFPDFPVAEHDLARKK